MAFTHQYTIRFSDTDAAGVVYFANVLNFCHQAYEESLTASGINLKQFFSNPEIAIPITHTTVDFYRPMYCGDKIGIELTPQQLDINRFEISYQITSPQSIISIATTKHICINPITRSKIELPQQISNWIQTTS